MFYAQFLKELQKVKVASTFSNDKPFRTSLVHRPLQNLPAVQET